jgi:hypothetical protein
MAEVEGVVRKQCLHCQQVVPFVRNELGRLRPVDPDTGDDHFLMCPGVVSGPRKEGSQAVTPPPASGGAGV